MHPDTDRLARIALAVALVDDALDRLAARTDELGALLEELPAEDAARLVASLGWAPSAAA